MAVDKLQESLLNGGRLDAKSIREASGPPGLPLRASPRPPARKARLARFGLSQR